MPGVRIELKRIENVNLKFKEGNVVVTLETFMPPGDVAWLYNISKQGVPMQAVIESPQAEFDLQISEVNTFTGELKMLAKETASITGLEK
jgi:hypothetical protein